MHELGNLMKHVVFECFWKCPKPSSSFCSGGGRAGHQFTNERWNSHKAALKMSNWLNMQPWRANSDQLHPNLWNLVICDISAILFPYDLQRLVKSRTGAGSSTELSSFIACRQNISCDGLSPLEIRACVQPWFWLRAWFTGARLAFFRPWSLVFLVLDGSRNLSEKHLATVQQQNNSIIQVEGICHFMTCPKSFRTPRWHTPCVTQFVNKAMRWFLLSALAASPATAKVVIEARTLSLTLWYITGSECEPPGKHWTTTIGKTTLCSFTWHQAMEHDIMQIQALVLLFFGRFTTGGLQFFQWWYAEDDQRVSTWCVNMSIQFNSFHFWPVFWDVNTSWRHRLSMASSPSLEIVPLLVPCLKQHVANGYYIYI